MEHTHYRVATLIQPSFQKKKRTVCPSFYVRVKYSLPAPYKTIVWVPQAHLFFVMMCTKGHIHLSSFLSFGFTLMLFSILPFPPPSHRLFTHLMGKGVGVSCPPSPPPLFFCSCLSSYKHIHCLEWFPSFSFLLKKVSFPPFPFPLKVYAKDAIFQKCCAKSRFPKKK